MSRRSSPSIIGAFVVAGLSLAVVGLITFGSGDLFRTKMDYVLYFPNSVQGLNVGAPVKFQGVRIGAVTDVSVELDVATGEIRIPVAIQIEPARMIRVGAEADAEYVLNEMIERGLRARLELQSFVTGLLFVDFGFYPGTEAHFVGGDSDLDELPTIPSSLEQLTVVVENFIAAFEGVSVDEMLADFAASLSGVEKLVNSPATQASPDELHATLVATRTAIRDLSARAAGLVDELETTARSSQKLLAASESRVQSVGDELERTLADTRGFIRRTDERLEPVLANVAEAADHVVGLLDQTQALIAEIEKGTAQGSPLRYELSTTLDELARAAAAIQLLASYLERHPEALLRGKSGATGQ